MWTAERATGARRGALPGVAALWVGLVIAVPIVAAQSGAQDDPAARREAAHKDGSVRCPECSRVLKPGFRFCPFDGSALERPRICSRCGREAQADWRYCPWDGQPLAEAGSEPDRRKANRAVPAQTVSKRPRAPGNPLDVVEQVFEALLERDRARLEAAYDWARFMPRREGESEAAYRERRAEYVARLFKRVRPLAEGAKRRTLEVKLTGEHARISLVLERPRSKKAKAVSQSYDFTLERDVEGRWRIVEIEP